MGNVKLDEDSREINTDRMYFRERKGNKLVIYDQGETLDSVDITGNAHEKTGTVSGEGKPSHSLEENKNQKMNYLDNNTGKSVINKNKRYEDEILYCNVCGKEFIFSSNDQKEYDKKGWLYPNRCPKCERRKYLPSWIKI